MLVGTKTNKRSFLFEEVLYFLLLLGTLAINGMFVIHVIHKDNESAIIQIVRAASSVHLDVDLIISLKSISDLCRQLVERETRV